MTTCIFSWDKKLQFTHSRYFSHNVLNVINSEFKLSPLSIPLLPLFFSSPGQSALGEGRLSSWFFIRSLEGSRRAGRGGDLGSLLTSASSTWSMDLLCCPVLSISRISARILVRMWTTLLHFVSTSPASVLPSLFQTSLPKRGEGCWREGLGQLQNSFLLSQPQEGFYEAALRSPWGDTSLYQSPGHVQLLQATWTFPGCALAFIFIKLCFLDLTDQKLQRIVLLNCSTALWGIKRKEKLKFPPAQLTPLSAAVDCSSPEGIAYRKPIYWWEEVTAKRHRNSLQSANYSLVHLGFSCLHCFHFPHSFILILGLYPKKVSLTPLSHAPGEHIVGPQVRCAGSQ